MKFSRITALLAAGALLLTACKDADQPVQEAALQNPLLGFVPGDTPYLFANLEATPAAVVDAYLARFQPSLDMAQAMLDDVSIEVSSDGSDDLREAALLGALLEEIDGKLNRAGLESLGLSLESHKAFYGMGVFPVVRVALRDADALRAAIGRVEEKSGMDFPALQSGEVAYWKIADANQQGGLYIAILADHLAVGLFPPAAEAEFLPEFLGQAEPPQRLNANEALALLNREKGFQDYGSGFVEFQKLVSELTQADSRTRLGLEASGQTPLPRFDPVCEAEIKGLVARAPRLVAGTTELSANAVGIKYQLEIEPTLAGELARLVSDVPLADDSSDYLVSMSLGIQLGRLREFLLDKASAWTAEPYQCPQLAGLNQAVQSGFAQLNRPMPPFVGNVNGFRMKLESLDFANPAPENARGMLVLEVEKPQMLVGMAQSFLPGMENLQLEPGSDPVEIPQELMTIAVEGMHISAAMSSDALAISMGQDQQAGLMDYLEAGGDNEGSFFSVSYDMAAQMELQRQMREQAMGAGADGSGEPEGAEMLEMLREVEDSYRAMLGRAWFEMRFTPQGFEIYNRMTFN
jgi:hypothetical protein